MTVLGLRSGYPVDAKRVVDVALAAIGLLLTAPLLALVALLIRLTSPGPAVFRQERVGRGGTLFSIHKFRTLRAGTAGAPISPAGDPRATSIGRVLRRTKIDELPQLIDVLRGDMSLVGPRPEVPIYVTLWPDDVRDEVLSVRPGITDPASIALRQEAELLAAAPDAEAYYIEVLLPQKLAMYRHYVRTHSLPGDLRLLVRTVLAVLVG